MLQTENLVPEVIRTVAKTDLCDVLVCRDAASASGGLFTVISVKTADKAKEFLKSLENTEIRDKDNSPYIGSRSDGGSLSLYFRYRPERKLASFQNQLITPLMREKTCVSLIMECMTTQVPFSVLYEALSEENLNISEDGNTYFNYFITADNFDAQRGEKECVNRCADIVLNILSGVSERKQRKLKSLILVRKKVDRGAYNTFAELYKDISFTQLSAKKIGLLDRLKAWFERNKDRLFRILITVCILLAVFALVMLVSNLLFGGFGWFSMRYTELDVIGTETLK